MTERNGDGLRRQGGFSQTLEDRENEAEPMGGPTFGDVLLARLSRRDALRGLTAAAAMALLPPLPSSALAKDAGPSTLTFDEIAHGESETVVIPDGYEVTTLVRWGDPIVAGAPAFDPAQQTPDAQVGQWGYNNDFVAFLPLPSGSGAADHGLLAVNFEYTIAPLMFPGIGDDDWRKLSREQVDVEMAAHGVGVVEIRRDGPAGPWTVVKDSPYNRRISALRTDCAISGPAAGDARLKTTADPTGTRVRGTINNCSGGVTPWGTVLSAEENFNYYFGGDPSGTPDAKNLERYGIKGKPEYGWFRFHDRFDVAKEPNEANRFGWIVEVDPYDPSSTPIKRTALGRFKHEAATCVVNRDGRVVVYSGDDERFNYIYRFVTKGRFDPAQPAANRSLLDEGVLSVARFGSDGSLRWLPLVFGEGPLTEANGFKSQADVLVETRRAADLLGATPMDRPEDVEANPVTGVVYAVLTNNSKRQEDQVDAVNPRPNNEAGHILELIPPGASHADRNHGADVYGWDFFILAGNPAKPEQRARYNPAVSADGWLACPDNIAFDRKGRLWIATDGSPKFGFADGAYASDVSDGGRALTRHFYRTPIGAELCGPAFNTDDTAFFVAVQHPGDSKGSTFEAPSTRWPDFQPGMPPRPTVQVIVKKGGGTVGS